MVDAKQNTFESLVGETAMEAIADRMAPFGECAAVLVKPSTSIGISTLTQALLEKVPNGVAIIYNSPKFPQQHSDMPFQHLEECEDVDTIVSKEVLV